MASLEVLHLEHLPTGFNVYISLYSSVKNATFLQQQLLTGNSDFEYAFIEANVIVSRKHLLAAAYRAINDLVENRLRTRNVHSEIVFALSPNNNIAESFRRFGITPSTTCLCVIKVSTPGKPVSMQETESHLHANIEGTQVVFDDDNLQNMADISRVKKVYKLNGPGNDRTKRNASALTNGAPHHHDALEELEMQILGEMALRSAT